MRGAVPGNRDGARRRQHRPLGRYLKMGMRSSVDAAVFRSRGGRRLQGAEEYVEDVPKIIKKFKEIKGMCAFTKCIDDRQAGKVKHCYANDRRWR